MPPVYVQGRAVLQPSQQQWEEGTRNPERAGPDHLPGEGPAQGWQGDLSLVAGSSKGGEVHAPPN